MQHELLIRAGTLSLAMLLPLTVGCVTEWHEDGDGWSHDIPGEDCGPGENWDPIDCICVIDSGGRGGNGGNGGSGGNDGGMGSGNDGGTGTGGGTGTLLCPDPMSAIFLSEDDASCAAVEFSCPEGYEKFLVDNCGCGCVEVEPLDPCPGAGDEGVLFVSTDPTVCGKVAFECPAGDTQFFAACGCGCIAPPPEPQCPDAGDSRVHYLNTDREVCDAITFTCEPGCTEFNDVCGCGCIEP